jgi:hypothetical protein
MKHNVGSFDAAYRAILGFGIFALGHYLHSWWGLIGLVPIATGVFAFCPLYCLFHFDTSAQDDYDDRDHHPPLSKTKNV